MSIENTNPAASAAHLILQAYQDYQNSFRQITQRAKSRFENCDWRGVHTDAVERLELYKKVIDRTVVQLKSDLNEQASNRNLWAQMKGEYSSLIARCVDYELAETFFNSITRRIFHTVGVDSKIEFVDSDFEPRPLPDDQKIYSIYQCQEFCELQDLFGAILADHPFSCGYENPERDAALAAQSFLLQYKDLSVERIEVLRPEFYRNFRAYLIGRLVLHEGRVLPLAFALRNYGRGVSIDAVLYDEDDVSIIFSFTRSYFHVQVDRPHQLVDFLKSIMPLKRRAELYIAIGYNKHGKTELYRELLMHLKNSADQFRIAPGEKGMVMTVFTLPSYDMVFKVIKDRIDPPKTTSRQEVMARYDLVFKHDRAGRLVDAQEFEHLTFERSRFSDALLNELAKAAPQTVAINQDTVDIKHLYIERRVTPLNIYIREAGNEAAQLAVIDYGQAIKDLAATNIFPGDILLKNFGVTRHGRVVFYDYDELCLVTDCKFRKIPPPRNFDDEFEADPWFYVGSMDIFPEEFRTFLGLQEPLRSVFIEHHGDLFEADYWKSIQAKHLAGELMDISSYPSHRRLANLLKASPHSR
jgi:isocitrate dehydrogenase kinase/phosphatase